MSGRFFVNPDVRVSRRNRVSQGRVLSALFRWLTGADRRYLRLGSRLYEAEFPLARLIVFRVLLFLQSGRTTGSPARDRASNDALRPNNNWVELEDTHDISIIGEKWPASARRLPQKGRQSPAPPERAFKGAGEEIVLAENHGALHRWKIGTGGQTGVADDAQQRVRAFAFAAQT